MRRCNYAAFLALAFATAVFGAPPTVTAPQKVYGEVGDWVWFTVTTDGKGVKVVPVDLGVSRFPQEKLKDPNEIGLRATKAGTYRVLLYTGNAEGPSEPTIVLATFGTPTPIPPGPDPPTPKPPDPKPPVPVESFRVIFVYESAHTLTGKQVAVMDGADVRAYLNKNTTPDATPGGSWSGWRKWDKDVKVAGETEPMKSLWLRAKPKIMELPCTVIEVNGAEVIEKFPATPTDAIILFDKYRGK